MKSKVYIETTIPSYLAAQPSRDLLVAAHQQITREWWQHRRLEFDLCISALVLQECGAGDERLAKKRLEIVEEVMVLAIASEASDLEHFQSRCIVDSTMTEPRASVVWGDTGKRVGNRLFQCLGGSGLERT